MLGSFAEAEDAVQEAWLRVSRASGDDVDNVGGWLTTIVSRQCLNMLRSRATRREDPLDVRVPDPVVESGDGVDPAEQAVLADSVGLALLVVLEALDPAERLAFVLHDMFAVPFEEIAAILGRTPGRRAAAGQPGPAAGRRARARPGSPTAPGSARSSTPGSTAARGGDFDGLVALLHPDAVLRVDTGRADSTLVRGAAAVAAAGVDVPGSRAPGAVRAWSTAAPGIVSTIDGRPDGGAGVHGRGRADRRDRHPGRPATVGRTRHRAVIRARACPPRCARSREGAGRGPRPSGP